MQTYPVVHAHGVPLSVLPASHFDAFATGGVYVMCRQDWDGKYTVLYVGQAADMSERLGPTHEKWGRAMRLGMTHLLINLTATTLLDRLITEATLISRFNPPLNEQKPTVASVLASRRGLGLAALALGR